MSLIDFEASIECSRGCLTLPHGDETNYHLDNTSDSMEHCPLTAPMESPSPLQQRNGSAKSRQLRRLSIESAEGLDEISGPPSPNDTFNYTAFMEEYKFEGDSLIRRAEMSDDDELDAVEEDPTGRELNVKLENFKNPSQIITEVQSAIEKKDGQVLLLISKLEIMAREKQEQENECMQLKERIAKLEEELKETAQSLEFDQSEYGPAEMSSYLHLPQNFNNGLSRNKVSEGPLHPTLSQEVQTIVAPVFTQGTSTCRQLLPPTLECGTQHVPHQNHAVTQVAPIQVQHMASQIEEPKKFYSNSSTQGSVTGVDAVVQATLPDETIMSKCKFLEESAASLKLELKSLREAASQEFRCDLIGPQLIRSFSTIEKEARSELGTLKQAHAQELMTEREQKNEFKKSLDQAQDRLKEKEEEILELKIKVAQLEYSSSRKVSEPKLISFSSRMSPEGSELDVDNISLPSDSMSHSNKVKVATLPEVSIPEDDSKSEHYEITRTKKEYLWLTPSAEVGTEQDRNRGINTGSLTNSVTPTNVVEDLKLQLVDLEKKFASNLRYLEEQTAERELERDEFQRESKEFQRRLQEIQRDRDRLQELSNDQKSELEDLDQRLTEDSARFESELAQKTEKLETDLKNSIDKIYELRGIIRDLEEHIDLSTASVGELRETNEILREELEKMLREKMEEKLLKTSEETLFVTANSEWPQDELMSQVQELADRLTKKLSDLENYKWSASVSRPGSGGSNASGHTSVCSEDVSVRDIVQNASGLSRDQELTANELLHGIRRLDVHFENFVKFEEIMMKKLRDTEIRLGQTMKRQTELELEKSACQEQVKEQLLRVSELESLLDQRRFEPLPNTLTLSDLRTRVKALTEELEQAKGQTRLKTIELEDLKEKMAASLAQRTNQNGSLNFSGRQTSPPVLKLSMTTQTKAPININKNTQTPQSQSPSVVDTACQTAPPLHFPSDMDVSSITGAPPPLHSTPTDHLLLQKNSKVGNQRSPLFQSLFAHGGMGDREELPPEALRRDPSHTTGLAIHDGLGHLGDRPPSNSKVRSTETGFVTNSNIRLLSSPVTSEHSPNTTAEGSGDLSFENETSGTMLAFPVDTNVKSISAVSRRDEEAALLLEVQALRAQAQHGALKDSDPHQQRQATQGCESQSIPSAAANLHEKSLRTVSYGSGNNSPSGSSVLSEDRLRTSESDLKTRLEIALKEKAEMDWRLEACETEAMTLRISLEDEQKKFAGAQAAVLKLAEVREECERKIKELQELCAVRTFEVEKLEIQMNVERKCLENELERLRGQLDSETRERRAIQEAFDSAKHHLQRHLNTDQSLRDENLRLMGELRTLRELKLAQAAEIDAMAQKQINSQNSEVLVLERGASGRNQEQPRRLPLTTITNTQNLENLELYLRAKSYRKALTWQKKYLILVIQGYKDLLDRSGAGVPHAEILQNEIPLTPTSLGLVDLRRPIIRFRICAKAVLATVRMKFMVRRWEGRNGKLNRPALELLRTRQRLTNNLNSASRRGSTHTGPWRSLSVVPGLTLSSLSTAPAAQGQNHDVGAEAEEVETVLSDYLRRIQSLESEVEGVFKRKLDGGQDPRS